MTSSSSSYYYYYYYYYYYHHHHHTFQCHLIGDRILYYGGRETYS